METWDPYERTNRIKLKQALEGYEKCKNLYIHFRDLRKHRQAYYCILAMDHKALKLNAIVQKYFFTDIEVRKLVKRTINGIK